MQACSALSIFYDQSRPWQLTAYRVTQARRPLQRRSLKDDSAGPTPALVPEYLGYPSPVPGDPQSVMYYLPGADGGSNLIVTVQRVAASAGPNPSPTPSPINIPSPLPRYLSLLCFHLLCMLRGLSCCMAGHAADGCFDAAVLNAGAHVQPRSRPVAQP